MSAISLATNDTPAIILSTNDMPAISLSTNDMSAISLATNDTPAISLATNDMPAISLSTNDMPDHIRSESVSVLFQEASRVIVHYALPTHTHMMPVTHMLPVTHMVPSSPLSPMTCDSRHHLLIITPLTHRVVLDAEADLVFRFPAKHLTHRARE